MSNSGRKINYAVRPAKSVERKMMRDIFNCLCHHEPLKNYRYVGFGSKYFVDFSLFHRHLGISKMISIEADSTNTERYEFNKPYSAIEMKYGKSTDVLPALAATPGKSIYWLDYDGTFAAYMLRDAAIISKTIESGSVYCSSFNCSPLLSPSDENEASVEDKLIELVGKDYVQPGLDTRGWRASRKLAVFLKECLKKEIQKILNQRNIDLDDSEKIHAEQIMFFKYSDGCEMATVGFAFYKSSEKPKHDLCKFDEHYFYSGNDTPFEIKTPNLTIKEIRHIMETMPNKDMLSLKIFTEKDIETLWQNYRYYPSFTEVEPL